MNIPDKIIEAIEILPASERGMVYCAVIGFMRNGEEPDFEMNDIARAAYILAREVLDPILRRRRRDAANRLRKRRAYTTTASKSNGMNPQPQQSDIPATPTTIAEPERIGENLAGVAMNRRQRRELERQRRKLARRA